MNPAAGDMHLVAGATPAFNSAPFLANAPLDWDGNARSQTSAVDYGADEYGGATPPPPPPTNRPPVVAINSPAAGSTYTAPATVSVTATASDPDGTVARVDFYAGSTPIGSDTTSPYAASWSGVAAGTYALTAVARDNAGASTTSATVTVVVSSSTGTALPGPWTGRDIGSPAIAGSATYANGTFTVKAAGADVWDAADQFQFVYQPMTGNGQVIARVATLTHTDGWTKAGVMIRSQLTTGSAHAFALVSGGYGTAFQRRVTAGGTSSSTTGPASVAPAWVRLVRSGNTFSAYTSSNGTSWTLIGTQSITMGATVYVGLAVTSHNAAALATSSLTNVQVIPAP
jgi:hypothetical protein